MPRLSIIVPHHHSDSRLESTLVSILENRPEDCEIIVVHDGSYSDPYAIADEVVFVQESPRSSTTRLLNAGLMAACSPAVCVLLDGALVTENWCESALELLQGSDVAAVSSLIEYPQQQHSAGIDARIVRRTTAVKNGHVEVAHGHRQKNVSVACAGPVLACGFYRRKTLLAMGGWNEDLDASVADIELAMAFHALGLICAHESAAPIHVDRGSPIRKFSSKATSQLASLLAAHGVVATGLLDSIKGLLADCVSGRIVSAFAWSTGLRDTTTIRRTQLRLANLRQQLDTRDHGHKLRVYCEEPVGKESRRRNAA